MAALNPKWLVGRTIVAVDMHATRVPFNVHAPRAGAVTMHWPEITLDNGARLRFVTEEHPDGAEYGTDIRYVAPPRRGKP